VVMGIVDGRGCRYKRLLGLWWVRGDSILGKGLLCIVRRKGQGPLLTGYENRCIDGWSK
jgi:hypothetical protein